MHGNVWDWVQDVYHDYNGAPADGSAWESGYGSDRVYRGGGWNFHAESCRSAFRYSYPPSNRANFIGFRLVVAGKG